MISNFAIKNWFWNKDFFTFLTNRHSSTEFIIFFLLWVQGVSYVSERFQEAIRRLWGHNTKNLFNKSKLIRFTRLQKIYFFSIYPPSASTTASNLLWALAQQLRIVSSSRSAHTFLRLLLRLSTLPWGFSQAFLDKIPHMTKSITLRLFEDGGRKHSGQNRWKLSWHHC